MNDLWPFQWALRPLKRYAEFSGRSSRAEFWWFAPFLLPVFLATWLGVVMALGSTITVGGGGDSTAGGESSSSTDMALGAGIILLGLLWLALIVPTAALQTRRLHDTNRSGWWVGAFYLLYGLYIMLLLAKIGAALAGLSGWPGMHDTIVGESVALWFVLIIYSMVLLVFFCLPGTSGNNRFGPDPYEDNLEEVFA